MRSRRRRRSGWRARRAAALRRGDATGAAGLLERAAALRPGDEALLLSLGVALLDAGRLEDAGRVLDEAIERASDPRAEARARVERELVRLHADPAPGPTQAAARRRAMRCDCSTTTLGRCRAWRLRAWIEWTETQYASAGDGLAAGCGARRARRRRARAARDPRLVRVGRRVRPDAGRARRSRPARRSSSACATARSRSAVTLRPLALLRALQRRRSPRRAG